MLEWLSEEYCRSDLSFVIDRADTMVLRAPIDTAVQTSFGTMHDRPALFLTLTDQNGSSGTGEVWCNFPACGAEHRAALLSSAIFPALVGKTFSDPLSCYEFLEKHFQRLAIQSGEFGPIAQCIAGIEIALWDLVASRLGVPLYRLLGGDSPTVNTYASGINPTGAVETVARCREQGYNAFKLKIGFGDDLDFANLDDISNDLNTTEELMVDANQAWTVEEAISRFPTLENYPLRWLEEPILATSTSEDWRRLVERTVIPLAGGENIAGNEAFSTAISDNYFSVIQPDICKWGGISQTLPIAKKIYASKKRYCPHYLGGGVGLIASAHLLAAAGGDGRLEIDSNSNPLRELLFSPQIQSGETTLTDKPGLGIDPEIVSALADQYQAQVIR